ncbi:metallophosphoesterase family protein [Kiritimatiellota bacterium B12222]|nr:metallophosphoesterase family protein [Kiritimatiellota bacterium B12222]
MKYFLLLFFILGAPLWAEPQHIVFTYMGDPSTSLTVNWQSAPGQSSPVVQYDTVSRAGNTEAYRHQATGNISQIPGLDDRSIYQVSLKNLAPATTYYLVVGNAETGLSSEIKVKTIADDERAIRFVTGGDMGVSNDTRVLLRHAASYDPDFAAVGGDIAYANGRISSVKKWDTWLSYYTEEMVTSDGYAIPVVFAIGNHEVRGSYNKPKTDAPFYFGLFAQDDEKSYFARQFGKNFVLFVLDSGHIASHESQVDWIKNAFSEYQDVPYKAAIYHVPLFPSHRDFMSHYADMGRQYWAPLFDEYGLTVGLENHDHTFKRSHFIKDGMVMDDGVGTLYLGDGCWGREAREVSYETRPYLVHSGSIQHFWVVDCTTEKMVYRAVDMDNQIFDIYPQSEAGAEQAQKVFDAKDRFLIMPDEVIVVEEAQKENNLWIGGEVTIRVSNPFPYPLTVDVDAHFNKTNIAYSGVPFHVEQLAPGAEKVFTTSFHFSPEAGAELKEEWVYLKLNAEYRDPEVEKPLLFRKTHSLKLVRPAE